MRLLDKDPEFAPKKTPDVYFQFQLAAIVAEELKLVGMVWTGPIPHRFLLRGRLRVKQPELGSEDGNGKYSCRDSDVKLPISSLM